MTIAIKYKMLDKLYKIKLLHLSILIKDNKNS